MAKTTFNSSGIVTRRERPWCLLELRVLLAKQQYAHETASHSSSDPTTKLLIVSIQPISIHQLCKSKPLPQLFCDEVEQAHLSYLQKNLHPRVWDLLWDNTLRIQLSRDPCLGFGPTSHFGDLNALCKDIRSRMQVICPDCPPPDQSICFKLRKSLSDLSTKCYESLLSCSPFSCPSYFSSSPCCYNT